MRSDGYFEKWQQAHSLTYLDWRPDTSLEIGGMWEVKGKNSDTRNPGFHLRQWANGSERKQFKATAKKYGHTIAEKKKN